MKKYYVMLLSSLIACSSFAMRHEDIPEHEQTRYCTVRPAQLADIYAVDKDIMNGVKGLRDVGKLTQDTALAAIEGALKPYKAKPEITEGIQKLYRYEDDVVSSFITVSDVRRFDVNESESLVALISEESEWISDDSDCIPNVTAQCVQKIVVYEESSRNNWKQIFSGRLSQGNRVNNMFLLGDSKQVVWSRNPEPTVFYGLDIVNNQKLELNREMVLEIVKKMKNNYVQSPQGVVDRRCMDQTEKVLGNTIEKYHLFKQNGFQVNYLPTLQEIAVYLVRRATQPNM